MKEQLSNCTERLFQQIKEPGLYVMPLATGGGKSYTIGKLACCYYPQFFRRIVILTIQRKLTDEMEMKMGHFMHLPESLIRPSEVLFLKDNLTTLQEAIDNGSLLSLRQELLQWINQLRKTKRKLVVRSKEEDEDTDYEFQRLESDVDQIKTISERFLSMLQVADLSIGLSKDNLKLARQEDREIRQQIRRLLKKLRSMEHTITGEIVTPEQVIRRMPSLKKAFPAVDWEHKRIVFMTVHKAMHGFDPIMGEYMQLGSLASKGGSLFICDESDRCALAMRSIAADKSQGRDDEGDDKEDSYHSMLTYLRMIEDVNRIDFNYAPDIFKKRITSMRENNARKWKNLTKDITTYNSIYLEDPKDWKYFRRGVFFSGPISNLYLCRGNDQRRSYIGHRKGQTNLTMLHLTKAELEALMAEQGFDGMVESPVFLWAILNNQNTTNRELVVIAKLKYRSDLEVYEDELRRIAKGERIHPTYATEPTLQEECYSLVSRFGLDKTLKKHIVDKVYHYAVNQKNIKIKLGDGWKRVPDMSVYMSGFYLFEETIDEMDLRHSVEFKCRSMDLTPEKIILSILAAKNDSEEYLRKEKGFFVNNAVLLSSATALCPSVIANLDVSYLESKLFDKFHWPKESDLEEYDRLNDACYPDGHRIETRCIPRCELQLKLPKNRHLPAYYSSFMDPEAVAAGLPEQWFRRTIAARLEQNGEDPSFRMMRLLQFAEVYYRFFRQEDLHSFLYFQNPSGNHEALHFHLLACLIDGSWKRQSRFPEDGLPTDWKNPYLVITNDMQEVSDQVLKPLSTDKDKKLMLIIAYNSFGVGANLQYEVPPGANVLIGDAWQGKKLQKDWDGIYLQMITHYLPTPDISNLVGKEYSKQLNLSILNILMLYERGCLSEAELGVALRSVWLGGKRILSKRINEAVLSDACYWAQSQLGQTTGRISRERVKPSVTYIFFDEGVVEAFTQPLPPGSYTREFRALAEAAVRHLNRESKDDAAEIRRVNDANRAIRFNQGRLTSSLRYYHDPSLYTETANVDTVDEVFDEISYAVQRDQEFRQAFKRIIVRYPVIQDWTELEEEERAILGFAPFYGDWARGDNGEITYYLDHTNRYVTDHTPNAVPHHLSPESVRLPQLVSNPDIRAYFEETGIACEWKPKGRILHPYFLYSDYCGELGEQAFLAICHVIDPSLRERIRPLTQRDYEVADFVLYDENDKRLLAFDVKNLSPASLHEDRVGDVPTHLKRQNKLKRLGCPLYTVNLFTLPESSIDPYEIGGLLYDNGSYNPSNIRKLKILLGHE